MSGALFLFLIHHPVIASTHQGKPWKKYGMTRWKVYLFIAVGFSQRIQSK